MLKELEVSVAKRYGKAPSWKQLYTILFIAVAATCLITMAGCAFVFGGIIERLNTSHEAEIVELRETLTIQADNAVAAITETKDGVIRSLNTELARIKTGYANVSAELTSLRYSYEMAVAHGSIELEELKRLWYVVKDMDQMTGLTTDMLLYSIDQCHKMDVDPNLMWLLFMVETESSKNNKDKATADVTDMARILPSTGKSLWENELGHGEESFNSAILASPYNRIRLAIAHVARDLNAGRTVIYAVDHYFGGNGGEYYGRMSRMARSYGLRIEGVTPIYGPVTAQFA